MMKMNFASFDRYVLPNRRPPPQISRAATLGRSKAREVPKSIVLCADPLRVIERVHSAQLLNLIAPFMRTWYHLCGVKFQLTSRGATILVLALTTEKRRRRWRGCEDHLQATVFCVSVV